MPMPAEPWRSKMRPASFRNAGFKVDVSGYISGRRTVTHEYPKRDLPTGEDMGRRAKRFAIAAYIVGGDYFGDRDALIEALETEGPGTLVHPYLGEFQVNVDAPFNMTERRDRGRMCEFEITFVEAGDEATSAPSVNTQAAVQSTAATAKTETGSALDGALQSQSGTITT